MNRLWDISHQLGTQRKRIGLSLGQLARRVNTSPATLSRYENGWSRFEVSTLRKLATALDCDLVIRLQPKSRRIEEPAADQLVEKVARLFWDQELEVDHLREYPLWVIERVLEYGDLGDIRMLAVYFGREEILRLVGETRFSSDRTRVFWHNILEREGTRCTRRYSREAAASSWRSSRG
jgi:transcriptional regulator with XRE-family HTH domain